LLIAFGLLVVKVNIVPLLSELPLRGDEQSYLRLSQTFFVQYWGRSDYFGPLQPAFLALVRLMVPDTDVVGIARVIQLVVHTVTALVVSLIGRELKDERVGFAAGVLYLVLPETVCMSYMLFSETWNTFWFVTGTWLYLKAVSRGKLLLFAGAGCAFGVASLFRSISLYFLPFMLVHLWLCGARRTSTVIRVVVLVLTMAVTISPQTYKNYRIFGDLLLISTVGHYGFWISHNTFPPPNMYYGSDNGFFRAKKRGFPEARPRAEGSTPAQKQRAEILEAVRFVTANPSLTTGRSIEKVYGLFHPSLYIFRPSMKARSGTFASYLDSTLFRTVCALSYVFMMMMATAGLLFCRERTVTAFSLALIGYHVLLYTVVFFPTVRYRMAFVPFLILYAGWALSERQEIWSLRKSWRGFVLVSLWMLMLAVWIPIIVNDL